MKTLLKFIFVLVLIWSQGFAQQTQCSISADLSRIYRTYTSNETLDLQLLIGIFDREISSAPLSYQQARVVRFGERSFQAVAGTRTLTGKKYLVRILDEEELIVVQNLPRIQAPELPGIGKLDSLLLEYKEAELIYSGKKRRHWRLYAPDNIIRQVDLVLDPEQNQLLRLEYDYNPRIIGEARGTVIEFAPPRKDSPGMKELLSESTYIRKKGGIFQPSASFSHYRIIDQTR